jgi:multiple sugar transport system ATP-binding protein
MTDDAKELAVDVGVEALDEVEHRASAGRSNVLARLNPRTTVRKGERVELVVDTHRLHFFDAGDGAGIYDSPAPDA